MLIRALLIIAAVLLAQPANAWFSSVGPNFGPDPGGQFYQTFTATAVGPTNTISIPITGVTAGRSLIVRVTACLFQGALCDTSPLQLTGPPQVMTGVSGSGGTCADALGGETLWKHPIDVWVCSNVTAGSHTIVVSMDTITGGVSGWYQIDARVIEASAAVSAIDASSNKNYYNGFTPEPATVTTNGSAPYNGFLYSYVVGDLSFTYPDYPGFGVVMQACDESTIFCEIYLTGISAGSYFMNYGPFRTSDLFDAVVVVLKAPTPLPTTIKRATLGNNSFAGGAPDSTIVGQVQVAMIGLPFSGTLALSGTDAAKFKLSSTTLPSFLELNGTQAAGTYNLNIVPTQAGATNSGVAQPISITASFAPPWGPTDGLTLWYDPSEPSTTFTDVGCTANSHSNGDTIKCIKDKSPRVCPATNSTGWLLTLSAGKWFLSGATGPATLVCATNIFQNVGYGNIHFAGTATSDVQETLFGASTNAGAGSARFVCGNDSGGVAGQGVGSRIRSTDGGTAANLERGSYSASLITVSCRISFIGNGTEASGGLFVNNVAAATSVHQGSGNLTDNTPSAEVSLFKMSLFGTVWAGAFYGLVVDTPSSAPSGVLENAIDSYLCTQAGLTC